MAALKGNLTNVYNSNGQLAEKIKFNPRSRLTEAGNLTGKVWQGSTHAYELAVNPGVLCFARVLDAAYIRELESRNNEMEVAERMQEIGEKEAKNADS